MSRNEGSDSGNELPSTVNLPIASQPRPPRNLQDLLRYSTEVSNLSGGSTVHHAPLDEESKQFLEGALKSLTVDIIEELMKSIKILQTASAIPPDGDPGECEEALDHIFDYVDNLDVANDFHKIGGFSVVKPCLESVHNSLRWRGAELVAELCQNNPYCQNKVVEFGLMPSLLKMIDTDTDETVRVKALYAVSCLARENEEGLQEFTHNDGFSVLLRALQTNIEKLNIKSAFLLSSLCHSKPCIKDDLVKMGYVEQLIGRLAVHVQFCEEGRRVSLEHLLSAILSILEDCEPAQEIARRPELQFKDLLDHILKNSEKCDQFRKMTTPRLWYRLFLESQKAVKANDKYQITQRDTWGLNGIKAPEVASFLVRNQNVEEAVRILNKIMAREGLIEEIKRLERYEKPWQTRRRVNYERCRSIYAEDMSRKLNFLMRKNRPEPFPGCY